MQFQQERTSNRRIRAFERAKNDMALRVYMVTVLWTGSDRFGRVRTGLHKSEQVWTAIFPHPWVACCPNLAHPQTWVQFSNSTSLETLRPSEVVETALRHTPIGVKSELAWSATFLRRTSKSDTSSESSCLAEFECKISPLISGVLLLFPAC